MKIVASTIFLQRRIRMFLAVSFRKRVIRGVAMLKAHYRGSKARLLVKSLKYNAVAKIQSLYRCYARRKIYVLMRKSATKMQVTMRGWIARHMKAKKLRGVRLLQRVWRGYKGRMLTGEYRARKVDKMLYKCHKC